MKMPEIKKHLELNNLSQFNLLDKLFPPPPYNCNYRRENPLLLELTKPTYREDWEQLESSTTGEKLPYFQRNIGEYDDYEVETISYREMMMRFRPRPEMRINYLKAQILRAKLAEQDAGIHHYEGMTDWYVSDLFTKVELPQLKAEIPKFDVEEN